MSWADKLKCLLGFHDWTCKAEQGILVPTWCKPSPDDNTEVVASKSRQYATGYCSRCRKILGGGGWMPKEGTVVTLSDLEGLTNAEARAVIAKAEAKA